MFVMKQLSKRSAGVAPGMNLRIPLHAGQWSTQARESTLALKPRADVTKSPIKGYQWPHKKDWCPPKIKIKERIVWIDEDEINCDEIKQNVLYSMQTQQTSPRPAFSTGSIERNSIQRLLPGSRTNISSVQKWTTTWLCSRHVKSLNQHELPGNELHVRLLQVQIRLPTLALKSRGDVTRNP